MKMTVSEKREFIRVGLHHELRCLLGAATLWRVFQKCDRGFEVVVAMDAAFAHSRCLFNFFTRQKSHDISVVEFGLPKEYSSTLYDIWEDPLHRHVLHISQARTTPSNVQNGEHLNEQVEKFARELLQLWERFESDPAATEYSTVLNLTRQQALRHAKNDAAGRISPVFT